MILLAWTDVRWMKRLSAPIRVLVTGSRGKSSVVRLLTSALASFGLDARGRITGVLPRELRPGGPGSRLEEVLLLRSGQASVADMNWWLSSLHTSVDAVVMENSAIAPELQHLASRWLRPVCSVLVNVRPDHEESWGRGEERAARALCLGLRSDCGEHPVILPRHVAEKPFVERLLREGGCLPVPCEGGADFRDEHLSIVESVCDLLGLDGKAGRRAASLLPPDLADFALHGEGEGILASAFSANDPESAESLFLSTGWSRRDTVVLFNSRSDRPGRLGAFSSWLSSHQWRRVCVCGGSPLVLPRRTERLRIPDGVALTNFVRREGLVFGCGIVAGAPLDYLESVRGRGGGSR